MFKIFKAKVFQNAKMAQIFFKHHAIINLLGETNTED